jgi:hypothetical protein
MTGGGKRTYEIRVTKAQVAAICALILIGQPYGASCRVVGCHPQKMKRYIPRVWRRGRHPVMLRLLPDSQRKIYKALQPTLGATRAYAEAVRNEQ